MPGYYTPNYNEIIVDMGNETKSILYLNEVGDAQSDGLSESTPLDPMRVRYFAAVVLVVAAAVVLIVVRLRPMPSVATLDRWQSHTLQPQSDTLAL
jgi:hypothetical protein